ncbi:uncharacterized protein LOC121242222 [Juglans microcarpa x Juglans regia]|uniref:uncharacterized protein LOC121242222 n=1 Tax=Juglans microcarpa x Juglans regia TaxID=2249226 RepID=UPI001B7EF5E3|nr:uncharacterized protein LOC121242222 [Juglans microcarpa x Juglans regia]
MEDCGGEKQLGNGGLNGDISKDESISNFNFNSNLDLDHDKEHVQVVRDKVGTENEEGEGVWVGSNVLYVANNYLEENQEGGASNEERGALVKDQGEGDDWYFTGVYGHLDASKRQLVWGLLLNLKPMDHLAWMRRKHNKLCSVKDAVGVIREGDKAIASAFMDHFQSIYSSSNPSGQELERCFQTMERKVTDGPDGFGTGFYQEHWSAVRGKASLAILDLLSGGNMPENVNHTLIALILKNNNPTIVHEYRPLLYVMSSIRSLLKL